MLRRSINFVCLFLFFTACVKDKPQVLPEPEVKSTTAPKVFVVNEGNYGAGNASLSWFRSSDQTVTEDYYRYQNNDVLGDVLQSICAFGGKYYLVVNNSGKVVVCDSSLKKIGQITNLRSPRYLLPINENKAYVSDLYANQIHVLDLQGRVKTAGIPCVGWTEQMCYINHRVFVSNVRRNYLYVINSDSDVMSDSIAVGWQASGLVTDKNGTLWLLCGGDKNKAEVPALYAINAAGYQVMKRFDFSANAQPGHLCINGGGDTLYYLNNDVYRFAIGDQALPSAPLIEANQRNFYGLNIGKSDHCIYVTDALDYVQKSNCYVYQTNGQLRYSFKAGINANGFYVE